MYPRVTVMSCADARSLAASNHTPRISSVTRHRWDRVIISSSGEEIVPCCPIASPQPLRFSQPDPHKSLQEVIRRPVDRASPDGEDEVFDRAFEGTHRWQQNLFCGEPLRHERDQVAREPERILPV